MAALVRGSLMLARKNLLVSCSRMSGSTLKLPDPLKGKVASGEITMPDDLGHSVGLERWEMLAKRQGIDDPFDLKAIPRAKGTREEPTIVSSVDMERTIGCVCEEDAVTILWMTLHMGEPKRCQCGYWFKLIEAQLPVFD